MFHNNLLRFGQALAISLKLMYDCRNTYYINKIGQNWLVKRFFKGYGKYFTLSVNMVDLDELAKDMPEECLKFLSPPPERKMITIANLKMNGNIKRLERYCDCLNERVVCMNKEKAKRNRGRLYKEQIYPDLVDVVVAPPYPFIEIMSDKLRKDCKDCHNCEECLDCTECRDCDCANCKECRESGGDAPCCQRQCLNFEGCASSESCGSGAGGCEPKGGECKCQDCGVCKFCQTCYMKDCEDCSICVNVGAQNSFPYLSGGLSGEVSPRQIREMGGKWVIIGSSERRDLFHESNELIAQKVRCALTARMKVVLCVSDSIREPTNSDDIEKQLGPVIPKIGRDEGTPNVSGNSYATKFRWVGKKEKGYFSIEGIQDWDNIVIAYEPLWALKKGVVPIPDEIQEKCYQVRDYIEYEVGPEVAKKIRIIYGGPVDNETAKEFANKPDIDGFLIGTTCFKIDQLIGIANAWFITNRPDASEIEVPDFKVPEDSTCDE